MNDTLSIKKSGIYKIINKVNGKYYIGSSNDIKGRWSEHKNDLKANRHDNDYLQKSWNKYGEENFEFEVDLLESIKKKRTFLLIYTIQTND